MKAIILVAGMGTRLKPFTETMPKCLTEVNGKAILVNALEILEKQGIKETTLVVGYLKDKIKDKIGEKFGEMDIRYTENPIYNKTNTSYSLWVALKESNLEEDLLILEGDVFFEEELLKRFIQNISETTTIVQKYNPQLDGSFVKLNNEKKVIDWIHKSVRKQDFTVEDKYKTVNIHKFSKEFLQNTFVPVLRKHIEEKKGAEPMEFVMQDIVKKINLDAFETQGLKWFEIDDADELKIAEKLFK